jgi:hypothetical protein
MAPIERAREERPLLHHRDTISKCSASFLYCIVDTIRIAMFIPNALLLLPIVVCISLADNTTSLPRSHKPTPIRFHLHAHSSISTSENSPPVRVNQDRSTATHTDFIWSSEPTSSASSPPTPRCQLPQSSCGSIGCYNPSTEQCCDEKNICEITHTCVEVQLHNGTTAAGCCPHAGLACDGICFDASTSKCCAAPGGTYGLCSANQDCCGNMCCDEDAVCASGFAGPMCWQRHDSGIEKTESSLALPAIPATPSTQTSRSMKITVSRFVGVLLLLVHSVAGSLEQVFPATRLQSPPILYSTKSLGLNSSTSPLDKRWYCIGPMEPCGDGCQNPGAKCCQRDDRTYGTCQAGDVCCQSYCCPSGTTCMIATGAHSSGPWCWPPGLPTTKENVPYDESPWPPTASGTSLKNTRLKNGSAGRQPSAVLCIIIFLLSLVAAISTLPLMSTGPTKGTVDDSAMSSTGIIPAHTPTEADLAGDSSKDEGGAIAAAHGHGGSGGHNAAGPGGGGHKSAAARWTIPRIFRPFV